MILQQDLIHVLHRAFLGAIKEGVRGIAYDNTSNSISIYTYLARKQEPDDYEVVDIALTEIMASLPSITSQQIKIIETSKSMDKLPNHKGWIFRRYGEV